jgi:AraC-like DNA-binding protein
MRKSLGIEAAAEGQPLRPSSLAEQALLAEKLDARGRFSEALGIANSLGLEDFGAAGLTVLFAPSLQEMERSLRNFAPLLNLRHSVTLHGQPDGQHLLMRQLGPNGASGSRHLRMMDSAKLARFFEDMLKRHGFTQVVAGDRPLSGRVDGALPVPSQLCGPLPRTNLTEFRRHQKAARKQMRELEHSRLGITVRRILIAGAGAGDRLPELPDVAKQLGYSQRTFRRRLTERGTSFMDCVNDVRHQLALRYLATTNFTVEVIAERLGYSDTSNFRHAFRRWTGVSPKAYVARAAADLPVTVMRAHHGATARMTPPRSTSASFARL